MDQELALKEFERNGLEALLLQEKFKNNPFVLKFHQNKNTSTGDIMNGPSSKLSQNVLQKFIFAFF